MKICIVSKVESRDALDLAQSAGWELSNLGHEVVYEDSIAAELGYSGVSLENLSADLVLVIGGDGSVLRAVRLMTKQIPVLGVNQGRVGFLTDLEKDTLSSVFSGLHQPIALDSRMRISVSCNERNLGSALNEAVIVTSRPSKMLSFTIFLDGRKIDSFRADGIIVSTPTGSTAYAMSAGGPIVDPGVEAILLVPIAPYMLSSRPYIFNTRSEVRIEVESVKTGLIAIDGQDQYEIADHAEVLIRKAKEPALFVDVGRTFFEKVEQKLRGH